MTKKEINERMVRIQELRFARAMKDTWTSKDFNRECENVKELTELVNELKAIGESAPNWNDILGFRWEGEL